MRWLAQSLTDLLVRGKQVTIGIPQQGREEVIDRSVKSYYYNLSQKFLDTLRRNFSPATPVSLMLQCQFEV